jgi:hypothetical protein
MNGLYLVVDKRGPSLNRLKGEWERTTEPKSCEDVMKQKIQPAGTSTWMS